MQGGGLGRLNLGSEGERIKNRRRPLWEMSGTIKVLDILLSSRGVDGRGSGMVEAERRVARLHRKWLRQASGFLKTHMHTHVQGCIHALGSYLIGRVEAERGVARSHREWLCRA